jgi:hypothetical protein
VQNTVDEWWLRVTTTPGAYSENPWGRVFVSPNAAPSFKGVAMKMIAIREFTYDNALIKVGDEFDTLHDQHAVIFAYNGMARRSEAIQPRMSSRRDYNRRDMRQQK